MRREESIQRKISRLAPADQTGFFIAASDFDLLDHVSRMIKRQGMVGMMDTAGRMQYLVDGAKGHRWLPGASWIRLRSWSAT